MWYLHNNVQRYKKIFILAKKHKNEIKNFYLVFVFV